MSIPKQITFINENEQFLIDTVKEFCGPVISTLGPGGCTVIITNDESALPHVTKDGVTVAESIFFKDQRKQAIAALIKEAAKKTATAVGDGTTTSVVLAQALILDGLKKLKTVKSKKEFFDGFDLAFEKITDYISESSISITKDSALLESVVKISANGDEKVVKTIMSAVKAAGPDGLVNVEAHDELKTIVDIKGGASLESNAILYGSKRWMLNGPIDLILINGALKHVHEVKSLIVQLSRSTIPVVIIAKEFSDEVVTTFSVNNRNRVINAVLVEAEGFARESRLEILEDLAVIFNVPIYSLDGSTSDAFAIYSPTVCEELSKAIITPTETILFRTHEEMREAAMERYGKLKADYDETKVIGEVLDHGLVRHLQRRMAKYNVVATIKVGASTKAEAGEVKDRIDDALSAISAAINGGISQGGGMALVRAALAIQSGIPADLSDDTKSGYELARISCLAPFRLLSINAGVSIEDTIVKDDLFVDGKVYDFKNCEIVNWLDAGIIDPTLVPISALTNASSVAKTILKSNSIISEWQDTQAGLS